MFDCVEFATTCTGDPTVEPDVGDETVSPDVALVETKKSDIGFAVELSPMKLDVLPIAISNVFNACW
jgi:hypothetical protein